jgi:hypothetical protein
MSFFLFTKVDNRKAKQVLSGGWGPVVGEDVRKGCRRVHMVEILYTYVWKWKK